MIGESVFSYHSLLPNYTCNPLKRGLVVCSTLLLPPLIRWYLNCLTVCRLLQMREKTRKTWEMKAWEKNTTHIILHSCRKGERRQDEDIWKRERGKEWLLIKSSLSFLSNFLRLVPICLSEKMRRIGHKLFGYWLPTQSMIFSLLSVRFYSRGKTHLTTFHSLLFSLHVVLFQTKKSWRENDLSLKSATGGKYKSVRSRHPKKRADQGRTATETVRRHMPISPPLWLVPSLFFLSELPKISA